MEEKPLFMSLLQTRSPTKLKNDGEYYNIYYVLVFYIPIHKTTNKPRIELFRRSYNMNIYTLEQVFEIAIKTREKLTLENINLLS